MIAKASLDWEVEQIIEGDDIGNLENIETTNDESSTRIDPRGYRESPKVGIEDDSSESDENVMEKRFNLESRKTKKKTPRTSPVRSIRAELYLDDVCALVLSLSGAASIETAGVISLDMCWSFDLEMLSVSQTVPSLMSRKRIPIIRRLC
nr:hypothetical protein [Tanacetum cinerariifolium]